MRRWSVLQYFILWLAAVTFEPTAAAPVAVTDDAGASVVLDAPAQRIVSLAPHITELLYTAGAGEKLVGTVQHSDFPADAASIPRVGSFQQLDYEQILALNPDLIIAWGSGNPAGAVSQLRRLGFTVYVSEPVSLEDIATSVERMGELAGTLARAHKAAADFRAGIAQLRQSRAGAETVTAFYQLWHEPIMTLNGQHLFSDILRLCGGRNIFADLPALAPTVSAEAVLQKNPQVILASGTGDQRPDWLDAWRRWENLRAVKGNHLYHLPPDLVQRATTRTLEGAEILCRQLERVRASAE